jgi:queuine tRNA-ribosyltransferase
VDCIASSAGRSRSSPTAAATRCSACRRARSIDETGAHFRSHLDGSAHLLTPEKAADIQARLGSDIAMVLDECLAHPSEPGAARESMERTLRWAVRGRERFEKLRAGAVPDVAPTNPGQAQFGIVQGSVFGGLRAESARRTVEIGFEAYAIGGLSVGEPIEVMDDMVAETTPHLPADRPRYLMGAGTPARSGRGPSRAASTCSTACCRRGTRGTASCSRAKAG